MTADFWRMYALLYVDAAKLAEMGRYVRTDPVLEAQKDGSVRRGDFEFILH